eukprot:c36208_g1_i1 orf=63-248(+)
MYSVHTTSLFLHINLAPISNKSNTHTTSKLLPAGNLRKCNTQNPAKNTTQNKGLPSARFQS